jgi:uncharacterized iron-regulated membrane protein
LLRVKQQFPQETVTKFKPSDHNTRSCEFTVTTNEGPMVVFVNPYNGDILGSLSESSTLMNLVKMIHGGMIAGTLGNRIIELTACWAMILIITGVFLWWPRGNKSLFGTLFPRFNQGKRIFWRDLHAVPAFWLSLLMVSLIFTGLPWSGVWGDGLNKFATATNTNSPPSLSTKPASTLPTRDIATGVPWAAELMPVPNSTNSEGVKDLSIDQVVRIAQDQKLIDGYAITFPKGETGVFTIAATPTKPENQATLHIDRYSGKVLDLRFKDYGVTAQIISIGIALHEGRYFGLANQIVGLIACVGIVIIALSGILMWWRRRPAGKLAAPSRPHYLNSLSELAGV